MMESKLNRSRIQRLYYTNFVSIILAVGSIIQGLAFNDLAVRFPPIYSSGFLTGNYIVIAHFVLCFVLLLRVFQTYVAAALDYDEWEINFSDVFIIFLIGLIEYFVFSSLNPTAFDVKEFHKRLSIMSLLGCLGYLRVLIKIRKEYSSNLDPSSVYYKNEIRLQSVNIGGIILVLGISTFIILAPPQTSIRYTVLGLISALILASNIFYSLRSTFSRPVTSILPIKSSITDTPPKLTAPKLPIDVRPAQKQDIDAVTELMMEHFSYVYTMLFDTSLRLTKRIFKSILLVNDGGHSLGYRAFHVAVEQQDDKVVGLVALTYVEGGVNWSRFIGTLGAVLVTIYYLGLVGLVRNVRK